MNLVFHAPLLFGGLAKYHGMPVEMVGPVYSEAWPSPLVKVSFPSGAEIDVFTDELIIKE